MLAWLHGQFVPERDAVVSVFDRGFLYGDGLFETLRFEDGCPVQWQAHWNRLTQGASALGIAIPWTAEQLRNAAGELILRNQLTKGILRITLTRGCGRRGYSPKGAGNPFLALTLHPAPESHGQEGLTLAVSSYRVLAGDPLLQIKSGSQLVRVMARAEAGAAGEALLLNHHGRVAEAASANLFWLQENRLHTPPLSEGALPGITRATLIELCPRQGLRCIETETRLEDLHQSEGVWLTNSSWGIVEATTLDGTPLPRSAASLLQACRQSVLCPAIFEEQGGTGGRNVTPPRR
jgi:aminodeoxychorismate lyase